MSSAVRAWARRARRGAATALLVPVPAAAGLAVGGAPALPPHVTVLYPFVGTRAVGADLVEALHETLGAVPSFDFALTTLGRFPGVLYAAPEPAEPFVALTEACVRRWPGHPPYGGAYDTVVPHLTLAEGPEPAGLPERAAAALPLAARAEEVWLMAPTAGGPWRHLAAVALSGRTSCRSR
jgi:2'-5' RNA ligase